MALIPANPRNRNLLVVAILVGRPRRPSTSSSCGRRRTPRTDAARRAPRHARFAEPRRQARSREGHGGQDAPRSRRSTAGELNVLRRLVPTENEVPALLESISSAARRAGLEFSDVQPDGVVNGDQFDTYKYKLARDRPVPSGRRVPRQHRIAAADRGADQRGSEAVEPRQPGPASEEERAIPGRAFRNSNVRRARRTKGRRRLARQACHDTSFVPPRRVRDRRRLRAGVERADDAVHRREGGGAQGSRCDDRAHRGGAAAGRAFAPDGRGLHRVERRRPPRHREVAGQEAGAGRRHQVRHCRRADDDDARGIRVQPRRPPRSVLLAARHERAAPDDRATCASPASCSTVRAAVRWLRSATSRQNVQYRVFVGSTLGRMRVNAIRMKAVVFTIDEFGTTRQDSLFLGDSTRMRAK